MTNRSAPVLGRSDQPGEEATVDPHQSGARRLLPPRTGALRAYHEARIKLDRNGNIS